MEYDYEPFIGEAEQTLDSANRVIIPASFRDNLKNQFYLCRGINEPCIWILPEKMFKSLLAKTRSKIPLTKTGHQRWKALITSTAAKKNLDSQNRLSVPQALLQYAGISDKVKIVGNDERAEIWALDRWNEVVSMDFMDLSAEIDQEYDIMGYTEE